MNAPLFPIAWSLIGGIVAGAYFPVNEATSLSLLVGVIVVTLLLRHHPRCQTVAIWLCTAVMGLHLSCRELRLAASGANTTATVDVSTTNVAAKATTSATSHMERARQRMLHARDVLLEEYRAAGLQGDSYAIVAAMTLGDKSALSKDLRHVYSVTGAGHALALSGLHLGIIYWLVTLLVPSRRWRIFSQVVTILAVWAFAFLTGLSASIIRSATMLSIYALLSIGYRDRVSINVLAFTAIVMLAVSPLAVFDISFQLSFMAVLSILLFFPLFYRAIPLPWLQAHRVVRTLWGMACLSLSAQIGVAPLIAFYFHRLATWFLLSNFLVVPGVFLVLGGAFLLLITSSTIVGMLLASTVTLMNQGLRLVSTLPFASIDGLHPTAVQTAFVYLFIGCGYTVLHLLSKKNTPLMTF